MYRRADYVSGATTDAPQVLRLTSGTSGNIVGIYTAVGVGYTDVGAKVLKLCEDVCFFAEVQVTP
jgi:hypothetical protein